MSAPRISAADIKAAATRLAGTVVQYVEDGTIGAAVYKPRMAAFVSIESTDDILGDDDGTILDLLDGVPARELVEEHGTPGRAAAAVNRHLRAVWTA
jgi:hypothetical protein